jgi:hypothetical protein
MNLYFLESWDLNTQFIKRSICKRYFFFAPFFSIYLIISESKLYKIHKKMRCLKCLFVKKMVSIFYSTIHRGRGDVHRPANKRFFFSSCILLTEWSIVWEIIELFILFDIFMKRTLKNNNYKSFHLRIFNVYCIGIKCSFVLSFSSYYN